MSFLDPNNNGIVPISMRPCMKLKDGSAPDTVKVMENGDWVLKKDLELYYENQQKSIPSQ